MPMQGVSTEFEYLGGKGRSLYPNAAPMLAAKSALNVASKYSPVHNGH